MRNAELFNRIADLIEVDPSVWIQEVWESSCGTAACIAGWACILGTDDFKFRKGGFIPKMNVLRGVLGSEDVPDKGDLPERINRLTESSYFIDTGGEVLGIYGDERLLLFDWDGHPVDGMTVPEALRAIADGEPVKNVWTTIWTE